MSLYKDAERTNGEPAEELSECGVRIRWTDGAGRLHEFPQRALSLFPRSEADRINRFVRESDRSHRYAAAGLLADLISDAFGNPPDVLIDRDRFGRPCLSGMEGVDISVSHSGEIVVCALSTRCRIGIDIELIRPVDIGDFKRVFPESLWKWLYPNGECHGSGDRADERFFHAWTRLESVIKADGRGLSAPLGEMVFSDFETRLGADTWYVNTIQAAEGYVCSLAANVSPVRCEVEYIADPG